MSTATKLLESMRRNPLDWRIEQLQTVARQHGIDWRQDGTSHCVFIRVDGKTLPVPAHRPIKPVYIKKFLASLRASIKMTLTALLRLAVHSYCLRLHACSAQIGLHASLVSPADNMLSETPATPLPASF